MVRNLAGAGKSKMVSLTHLEHYIEQRPKQVDSALFDQLHHLRGCWRHTVKFLRVSLIPLSFVSEPCSCLVRFMTFNVSEAASLARF